MPHCLSSFDKAFKQLTERPKHGYSSLSKDINQFFDGKSFNDIYNHPINLFEDSGTRIVKVRLANSGQNQGKSGGFRLIFAAISQSQRIVLMTVYPKKGKFAMENLPDSELEDLILELAENTHSECDCLRLK